jgi:hypothetical protein
LGDQDPRFAALGGVHGELHADMALADVNDLAAQRPHRFLGDDDVVADGAHVGQVESRAAAADFNDPTGQGAAVGDGRPIPGFAGPDVP